jgi:RNA polymerase sigma-70 factor, ECF subfamily
MNDRLADFERHRRYLTGVAYRMLGTISEAEDVVQEAYIRLGTASGPIDNMKAYLTRIVTRLCLDVLKSAHRQRMTYVGPWLPEPLHDISDFTGTKVEGAAFLLHDVFGEGFAEIAATLERSEAACRQLAARARKAVRQSHTPEPSRFEVSASDEAAFLQAFLEAAQSGDVSALEALLIRDVKLYSDGGGKAQAAINILEGRDRVLKFMIGIYQKFRNHTLSGVEFREVNGALSIVSRFNDGTFDLMSFEHTGDQISAIYIIRNPDKLKVFKA